MPFLLMRLPLIDAPLDACYFDVADAATPDAAAPPRCRFIYADCLLRRCAAAFDTRRLCRWSLCAGAFFRRHADLLPAMMPLDALRVTFIFARRQSAV